MSFNDKLSFLDQQEDKLSFLDESTDKLSFLDEPTQSTDYGMRQNNTPKGKGYFGEIPLKNKKGVMTELGSEVDIDLGNGEERLHYPLIVPTLTKAEIDELASGKEPSKTIQDKAINYAIERRQKGLDPFALTEEEGKTPIPKTQPVYDQFGVREDISPLAQVSEYLSGEAQSQKSLQSAIKKKPVEMILAPLRGQLAAMEQMFGEMKVPKGGEILPKNASEAWRAKAEEGLTDEEKQALQDYELTSTLLHGAVSGSLPKKPSVLSKYLKLTEPKPPPNPIQRKLESIQKVLESPTAGKNEKVAAQRAIDRLTGKYDVDTGLEKIAKSKGTTKDNVLQRIWDKLRNWSKEKLGKTLTPENITPEESLKFIEYVEKEELAIPVEKPKKTKVEPIKPTEVEKPVAPIKTEIKPVEKPKKPTTPPITEFKSLTPKQQEEYSKLLTDTTKISKGTPIKSLNETQAEQLLEKYNELSNLEYLNDFDKNRFKNKIKEIETSHRIKLKKVKPPEPIKPEAVKEPVVEPKKIIKPELVKTKKEQKEYIINEIEEAQKNPVENNKLKIEVPNDGTLKINNNPLALRSLVTLSQGLCNPNGFCLILAPLGYLIVCGFILPSLIGSLKASLKTCIISDFLGGTM